MILKGRVVLEVENALLDPKKMAKHPSIGLSLIFEVQIKLLISQIMATLLSLELNS